MKLSVRVTMRNARLFASKASNGPSKPKLTRSSPIARGASCTHAQQIRAYRTTRKMADAAGGGHIQNAGHDRDFYLSVLNATSSKREARSYLQRFAPPVTRQPVIAEDLPQTALAATEQRAEISVPPASNALDGRNQTHVDRNRRAAQFLEHPIPYPDRFVPKIADEELHVALVKIRDIDSISDSTLGGIGRTLGQLKRLGLLTIVVLDDPHAGVQWRAAAETRTERMITAIEASRGKARRVDGAIMMTADSLLSVSMPHLLAPLARGLATVLTPVAFDSAQKIVHVDANDIVQTLVRLFSASSPTARTSQPASLDRLIFLDQLGGIPAPDRPSGAHVFVNLEQEYTAIAFSLAADGHSHHLKSLKTLRAALSLLPSTASGIITTPSAAATPPRAKNPLIHNLLTDKPLFSSSLPTATSPSTQTTLLKHGTPLRLFPSSTRLTDPAINLPKLVALIEDSFGKPLDVGHYLARVNHRIAGLIIAGDYEGAAIMTWETPPQTPAARRICYLDKFAVAKRSQGVGGVADVVFKAMTANFGTDEGIVWRSRRKNPVNKWYFERAQGTWKFPEAGDMWTMFWTTQDARVAKERFGDYVDVCKSIQPSLKDDAG